jgi:hypothetical protein
MSLDAAVEAEGLRSSPEDVDAALATVLDGWRTAGRDLVALHAAEFDRLVDAVAPRINARSFRHAAAAAQVAANYAVFWHPGKFASHKLESAIAALGRAALPAPPAPRSGDGRLRVLHVATQVGEIGGHVRMMWRWIGSDPETRHSVALTRQTGAVPARLSEAVAACGGAVHLVNRAIGGPLEWARSLCERLADADIVVLHVHNQDIVPFLALAALRDPPKIVLLNHADHVFWLGAAFADVVVNTRTSGHELSIARRGFPRERSLLLPLCLEPALRQHERGAAKRALGLTEDSLVVLTIARAVKFRSLGGVEFPDAMLPLLEANERIKMVVVGPGGTVDWSRAEARAPGQILVYPETPDTRLFYDAADIYLDSFPFPSNTSLLEAGLNGVPTVARFAFGPGCAVMGPDSIGLDPVLIRADTASALRRETARLLGDAALRAEVGKRTRETIAAANGGSAWKTALAEIYARVLALPARASEGVADMPSRFDDLDVLLPFVFGTVEPLPDERARLANAREIALKTLPPLRRLRLWSGMAWHGEFRFRSRRGAWRYLVPEWSTVRSQELASSLAAAWGKPK